MKINLELQRCINTDDIVKQSFKALSSDELGIYKDDIISQLIVSLSIEKRKLQSELMIARESMYYINPMRLNNQQTQPMNGELPWDN